jgi:oxygen-independent coproporphyrinogen-3 oxidase
MKSGYAPVGIDHFALPGDGLAQALKEKRLHRNFQGYTADHEQTLIAFGQTSISQYGSAYVQNTDRNREYRDKVSNGEFPVVKSCPLSPEDIYRRAVIESIMCYGEVDLLALDDAQQWADTAWESALPALAGFAADGLVKLGDMDVTVTPRGQVFTRLAASAFDAYLPQAGQSAGAPRHARAV